MAKRPPSKPAPKWTDVKSRLAEFDRPGLLGLIQDLYSAHEDTRIFLHTRFGLGQDALELYKKRIDRWLYPDVFLKQDVSLSKARQAIADYQKAVGQPEGRAELTVYYCEQAAAFCKSYGNDDWAYLSSMLSMFAQALKLASTLPAGARDSLVARLDRVRGVSHKFGYGLGEEMDLLLSSFAECAGDSPPPALS